MSLEIEIFEMQARLCQSMGHAIRLRIVHLLKTAPKSVNEISAELDISQPSASRHLAVLRATGILIAQRRAQEVYYEIANPKIVDVCEMMRQILAERETQHLNLIKEIQG